MHLERLDSEEVQGLLDLPNIWIEPKIDGANASVLIDEAGVLRAGKRSAVLAPGDDFNGLTAYVYENQQKFLDFFAKYPNHIIYGEWLIPHSLKVYRPTAWRKFYAFDIMDATTFEFYNPDTRVRMLGEFGIEQVMPMLKISGPVVKEEDLARLQQYVEENKFLIDEPGVIGEGVVIKAFTNEGKAYRNQYGRITWAKIVRQEFKEKNAIEFGARTVKMANQHELLFAETYITDGRIEKCKQKIMTAEATGWRSQYIGKLLGMVYHDAFQEELLEFVKENKIKKLDIDALNKHCIIKAKELLKL